MFDLFAVVAHCVGWFKWIVAWCIRHVLQIFFFLPVQKNRILFSAYHGLEYCCNPRYISEYLIEHWGNNLDIIWGFVHPENYKKIPGIKAVRINSPAWFYYTVTSSVVIMNIRCSQLQSKKGGQLLINTWHGGGAYKRVGRGVAHFNNKLEDHIRRESVQKIDLFLSSSQVFTEQAIQQDYGYEGEVLPCGMPRNDLLFSAEHREAAARCIRDSLGVTGYIVIYAPTFRGKNCRGYCTRTPFPYQEVLTALRQKFGEPAVILMRAHPGGIMADGAGKDVLDVTTYPDMQKLLCAADMLITDYSSSIWDFAILGRPCLLYVPDLEDYAVTRGLCTPPEEWPGIVCRSDRELLTAISTLDRQACADRAAMHLQMMGSYETGTATEQVCARILQHIGRKDIMADGFGQKVQGNETCCVAKEDVLL